MDSIVLTITGPTQLQLTLKEQGLGLSRRVCTSSCPNGAESGACSDFQVRIETARDSTTPTKVLAEQGRDAEARVRIQLQDTANNGSFLLIRLSWGLTRMSVLPLPGTRKTPIELAPTLLSDRIGIIASVLSDRLLRNVSHRYFMRYQRSNRYWMPWLQESLGRRTPQCFPVKRKSGESGLHGMSEARRALNHVGTIHRRVHVHSCPVMDTKLYRRLAGRYRTRRRCGSGP